jgi:hypothetical protein
VARVRRAFPLIAILGLRAGPAEVAALAAAGLRVGAAVAVPLGPWIERRRKRSVMIAMDLTRFAALLTVPAAFALGRLGFPQLLIVAVVVGAADIAFKAASGACLKALPRQGDLLAANGWFESTTPCAGDDHEPVLTEPPDEPAGLAGPRAAIAAAGLLILATPLLLPRRDR